MHYYNFNIGDYSSHTNHLEPLEDIAYRRMLDWYYLHESPLPDSMEEIARLTRMRTHCECIADVVREFFTLEEDGYHSERADRDIAAYRDKSAKAKASADARWSNKNKGLTNDANGMRPHSERNANHKPLTNNHKPITNKENSKAKRFTSPTVEQVGEYWFDQLGSVPLGEPQNFIDFYESKGWMVGKNKMKDWKAAIRTWIRRSKTDGQTSNNQPRKNLGVVGRRKAAREQEQLNTYPAEKDITSYGSILGPDD